MTAQRISMPAGKPESGTVFFVYRAKMHTGSSMHTAGAITEDQHRAIAAILQGQSTAYDGRVDNHARESIGDAVATRQDAGAGAAGAAGARAGGGD